MPNARESPIDTPLRLGMLCNIMNLLLNAKLLLENASLPAKKRPAHEFLVPGCPECIGGGAARKPPDIKSARLAASSA